MNKKESNQKVLAFVGIIILLLAVVGVSYAAFQYSKTGEKVNTITTSTIVMSYNEITNGINLVDAYPMSDAKGMSLSGTEANKEQYFDFNVSVSISGDLTINYTITATKEMGSTIPDSGIKVYLTSLEGNMENQILSPTLVSSLKKTDARDTEETGTPPNQYLLKTDSFQKTGNRSYRLRMWIDQNYVGTAPSEIYKIRVNVYGKAK